MKIQQLSEKSHLHFCRGRCRKFLFLPFSAAGENFFNFWGQRRQIFSIFSIPGENFEGYHFFRDSLPLSLLAMPLLAAFIKLIMIFWTLFDFNFINLRYQTSQYWSFVVFLKMRYTYFCFKTFYPFLVKPSCQSSENYYWRNNLWTTQNSASIRLSGYFRSSWQ